MILDKFWTQKTGMNLNEFLVFFRSVATTNGRRPASNGSGGFGFGSHAAAGFGVICRGATSARCTPGDRICAQQPNQGRDIPVSGIQQ